VMPLAVVEHARGTLPEQSERRATGSVARRSWGPSWRHQLVAEESEDPWLCAPGFRRVCLCRGGALARAHISRRQLGVKELAMRAPIDQKYLCPATRCGCKGRSHRTRRELTTDRVGGRSHTTSPLCASRGGDAARLSRLTVKQITVNVSSRRGRSGPEPSLGPNR
jgi:hypothetical protein